MTKRVVGIFLTLALFCPPVAFADSVLEYKDGVKAYKKGNLETAVKMFNLSAEHGNTDAQFMLGMLYDKGRGVPQDKEKAVFWYRHAADHGHVKAQYYLAIKTHKGEGVPQNFSQAVKGYEQAASHGIVPAMVNVGVIYTKSHEGVPRDYVKAYMWFDLAAFMGSEKAKKNMASVAKVMTPEQMAQGKKLSDDYWTEHFQK